MQCDVNVDLEIERASDLSNYPLNDFEVASKSEKNKRDDFDKDIKGKLGDGTKEDEATAYQTPSQRNRREYLFSS